MTSDTYKKVCDLASQALLLDAHMPEQVRVAIGELYTHANKVTENGTKFSPVNWRDNLHNKAYDLVNKINVLNSLCGSDDLDWESKYDVCYKLYYREIVPVFDELGIKFDYYDPDTTYQEDVLALVKALVEKLPVIQVLESTSSLPI